MIYLNHIGGSIVDNYKEGARLTPTGIEPIRFLMRTTLILAVEFKKINQETLSLTKHKINT